uniref:4Fe-4S ferredoxin-type domain-containing protein n=1 Tax=Candidatus Kentrum sp. TUN TaxID=2126343 RepID=A0A450ZZN3_9GAMM|nr:MAG: hypothetical protein BECKTUN1418F_GA0071002_11672 [Candidatus Kentron sp. TUN]VFK67820.1 MAG: hypothetical protein BECKTUN1418E_GA0071001_11612 [Candidatus Kentron sp. TUN]
MPSSKAMSQINKVYPFRIRYPIGTATHIEIDEKDQSGGCGVCQQSCPVMFTIIYKLFVP